MNFKVGDLVTWLDGSKSYGIVIEVGESPKDDNPFVTIYWYHIQIRAKRVASYWRVCVNNLGG